MTRFFKRENVDSAISLLTCPHGIFIGMNIKKPALIEKMIPFLFRMHKRHRVMIKDLVRNTDISESEIIRQAIEEKHARRGIKIK